MSNSKLLDFIIESNAIESIFDKQRARNEVPAYQAFLAKPLTFTSLVDFTLVVAPTFVYRGAYYENGVRSKSGMDVSVGSHYPLPGGLGVVSGLKKLVADIRADSLSPFDAHIAYETLHPFMDGNGRSGRAVWLHMMEDRPRAGGGFLHEFYYQTLQTVRDIRNA